MRHVHDLLRDGDVRGKGLFFSIELVRSRETKQPANDETAAVVELMRENGVLVALIGEHRNVVKIRPPLVFTTEHADIALAALDDALLKVG